MNKYLLRRNYITGWCTLRRDDAINGLVSSLSKRKGVQGISIWSCNSAQLEGDKGYEMQVDYKEDLDETFGFPENLEKVIFLDTDSSILPYNVERVASETQAGIVITNPSLKDEYYDVGNLFPQKLAELIENANKNGVQIVGITPSISRIKDYGMLPAEMMEHSISRYLYEHPSIKNFIVVNREAMQSSSSNEFMGDDILFGYEKRTEDMQPFSANVFIGHDIPFGDEKKAKDMLNGQSFVKKR